MKRINTIVFDIYETVVFPQKHLKVAPLQAFINTFSYFYSKDFNKDKQFIKTVNKHMGKPKKEHLKCILEEYPKIENIDIDTIYNTFSEIQCEILLDPRYCVLEPNYLNVEQQLYNLDVKNICFTTGFNYVQTAIIMNNIPQLKFNKIITTDTISRSRPYPDGINSIIKHCHSTNENVIKVGDTIADIEEGLNANVISVGVTSGSVNSKQFLDAGAHYVIDNLSILPLLVKDINKKNE